MDLINVNNLVDEFRDSEFRHGEARVLEKLAVVSPSEKDEP